MVAQPSVQAEYGILASSVIPLRTAEMQFLVFGYQTPGKNEVEDIVVLRSAAQDGNENRQKPPLVRLHSACLTGDLFDSLKCDCGAQLNYALNTIATSGGALLYLLRDEGRGIGLANKIRAYALQRAGYDTISANLGIGLPVDTRDFRTAAIVLQHLGLTTIRLLTNNPDKITALERNGIVVTERVHIGGFVTQHNLQYLTDKDLRLSHFGARYESSVMRP